MSRDEANRECKIKYGKRAIASGGIFSRFKIDNGKVIDSLSMDYGNRPKRTSKSHALVGNDGQCKLLIDSNGNVVLDNGNNVTYYRVDSRETARNVSELRFWTGPSQSPNLPSGHQAIYLSARHGASQELVSIFQQNVGFLGSDATLLYPRIEFDLSCQLRLKYTRLVNSEWAPSDSNPERDIEFNLQNNGNIVKEQTTVTDFKNPIIKVKIRTTSGTYIGCDTVGHRFTRHHPEMVRSEQIFEQVLLKTNEITVRWNMGLEMSTQDFISILIMVVAMDG